MTCFVRLALMLAVCACLARGQAAQQTQTITIQPGQTVAMQPGQEVNVTVMPVPADVYKQAMRPLEQVRASLENWSDAELGALAAGVHIANEACAQMKPENYSGDALYDLAHLCAFGQDWDAANVAAVQYIARGEQAHRTQAYALSVNALMHQKAVDLAVSSTRTMMSQQPYDAEVAFTLRYMKDSLEQMGNSAGLALAKEEHDKIVQALKLGAPLKATNGDAVMDVGSLYDSAMELAFLLRYARQDADAASAAADCDNALGTAVISAEDRQHVDGVRKRYGLLGTHLPGITVTRALISPTAKAELRQNFGLGTVLVLFPDWCVQCRHMMKTLTEFAKVNATTPLFAYGLAFVDMSIIPDPDAHSAYLKEMQGTSTLVVPVGTPQTFGVSEFPMAIVVDAAGMIRFIGPISADAFNGNGYIEKVIQRMVPAGTVPNASEGRSK